jgi:hypothetical protein
MRIILLLLLVTVALAQHATALTNQDNASNSTTFVQLTTSHDNESYDLPVTLTPMTLVAVNDTNSNMIFHNVNIIVLVDISEPILEVIFKYIEWIVHDQKLFPENYRFK